MSQVGNLHAFEVTIEENKGCTQCGSIINAGAKCYVMRVASKEYFHLENCLDDYAKNMGFFVDK